jgi:hypothetical protein
MRRGLTLPIQRNTVGKGRTGLTVWYFRTGLTVWYFRTGLTVWYFRTGLTVWYFGTGLTVWYLKYHTVRPVLPLPTVFRCVGSVNPRLINVDNVHVFFHCTRGFFSGIGNANLRCHIVR